MPQHTIIATINDRPGCVARSLHHLDATAYSVRTLSVARSRDLGIVRLTLAVDARHASSLMQHLGSFSDVIAVTDGSLALRLATASGRPDFAGDYREQADGAPCEYAA